MDNPLKKKKHAHCIGWLLLLLALSSAQFGFVLFAEAVSNWEEIPATLLIHIPDIRLLTRVLCIGFVNQMHQEEPVLNAEKQKETK